MRALVLFLLIANVALFLWVRHDNLSSMSDMDILPPEIGKLRLRNEPTTEVATADLLPNEEADVSEPGTVEDDAAATSPVDVEDSPLIVSAQAPTPEEPSQLESLPSEQSILVPVESSRSPLETTDDAVPVVRCTRVGPLESDDADDLVRRLPARFQLLADTSSEHRVATGYYVLVPPLPDRAEGRAKLRELQAAGFKDVWLFRGGEFRNAISLGLFSNAAGAERHAQAVARKGFDVEVRDKSALSQRRWLVLQHGDEDDLKKSLPLPQSVRLISQPCP